MLSVPSPRRWMIPCISLTILILLIHSITKPWDVSRINIDSIIQSHFQQGTQIHLPLVHPVDHSRISDLFTTPSKPSLSSHIAPLMKCPLKINNVTNAVRLPHTNILNISLTPPDALQDDIKRYFNPTLIPLPPHSPYPYLLLSRLVTAGLHQESHVCFATFCLPPSNFSTQTQNETILHMHGRALPVDAHVCTSSDMDMLGPQGGVRCATAPTPLNIPPTPAMRCQGAWTAFPDIPGFHDPRVFWSGSGEPLVMVNSGSGYACVGLWVVDLRAVHKGVEEIVGSSGREKGKGGGSLGEIFKRGDGLSVDLELDAKMRYPFLTELTRNPRESRGMVEKNWIMFFPRGDESWVQYDLVSHGVHKKKKRHDELVDDVIASLQAVTSSSVNATLMASSSNNRSSLTFITDTKVTNELDKLSLTLNTSQGMNISSTEQNHEHAKRSQPPKDGKESNLIPSRTFAKIIGAGYTTQNLTLADEVPCLTAKNVLDSMGNTGHWHQGSNSLRLILCSRQDNDCLGNHDENLLVKEGKVVHFAILHRKFSNDLDLPMRYERHIMVWEARYPFRMIGISKSPVLFSGERAQPWNETENEFEDGDEEARRWANVYFMYTPSLAWSWRRESLMAADGRARVGLGTGYLGDEVLVGIGMDDVAQGIVRVKVDHLISCLRLCPDFQDEQGPL